MEMEMKILKRLNSGVSQAAYCFLVTASQEEEAFIELKTRRGQSAKKVKIVAGSAVIIVLLIVGGVLGSIALRHHLNRKEQFEAKARVEHGILKENIVVDYKQQVIVVSNQEEEGMDGLEALHDYSARILAFRDTTNGRCFIERLEETFEEGLNKWEKFSTYERVPTTRKMVYIQEPIDSVVLRTCARKSAEEHCEGVKSFWLVEPEKGDGVLQAKKYRDAIAQFQCGFSYEVYSKF